METKFSKPKRFGQILDHTFSLSKQHFSQFILILLLFLGPVYLIQALIQMFSGVSFFREMGAGEGWLESVLLNFDEPEMVDMSGDIGVGLVGLLSIFIIPVAIAAIIIAIDQIRKGEEYTVASVIKQAFSRYWPLLGSTVLFGIMTIGLMLVPIFIVTIVGLIAGMVNPVLGFLLAAPLLIIFFVVIGYLFTRWSFYFASVVFNEGTPGIGRSWRLSKGRGWALFGLYIVFSLIMTIITAAIEFTFGLALGNSVLLMLIINLASLFTTMIFTVGYAVMYFDLKVRHDADDLKEMIDDYQTTQI